MSWSRLEGLGDGCMQAVAGIPETGVCDSVTWDALLGEEALQQAIQEAARLVSFASTPPSLLHSTAVLS